MKIYKYDIQTKEFLEDLEINEAYGTNLPFTTIIKPLAKKDGFAICFNGTKWEHIEDNRNKTVYIKATSDKVYILNNDYELIMEHPRLYGKGKESMKWLPYIELMSKRPTALKYTTFYEELPDNWRKYLNSQDSEGKRKGLVSLHSMLTKHDMRTSEAALDFALSNGVKDSESILNKPISAVFDTWIPPHSSIEYVSI